MARLKLILRMGGIVVFCIGVSFLPVGYGANPKADLSVFTNIVDMGSFISDGMILMAVGVVACVASALLPGEMDDSYWG